MLLNDEDEYLDASGAYYCSTCSRSFDSEAKFEQHVNKHHSGEPNDQSPYPEELDPDAFQCLECHKKFPDLSRLQKHMNQWKGGQCRHETTDVTMDDAELPDVIQLSEDFICSECGEEFTSAHHLQIHVSTFHSAEFVQENSPELSDDPDSPIETGFTAGMKRLPCSDCGRNFISAKALKIHMNKTHNHMATDRRPNSQQVQGIVETSLGHVCDECGRRFPSPKQAKVHKFKSHIQPRKKYEESMRRHQADQLAMKQEAQFNKRTGRNDFSVPTSNSNGRNLGSKDQYSTVSIGEGSQFNRQKWTNNGNKINAMHDRRSLNNQPFGNNLISKADTFNRRSTGSMKEATPTIQNVYSLTPNTSSASYNATDRTIDAKTGHIKPPSRTLHRCRECSQWFSSMESFAAHKLSHHGISVDDASDEHTYLGEDEEMSGDALRKYIENSHDGRQSISSTTSDDRGSSTGSPHNSLSSMAAAAIQANFKAGPDGLFPCPVCRKRYRARPALHRHLLVHQFGKAFTCRLCNSSFTREYSMKLHRRLTCPALRSADNQITTAEKHPDAIYHEEKFKDEGSVYGKPSNDGPNFAQLQKENNLKKKKKYHCPRCGVGCNHASNLYTHCKRYCQYRFEGDAADSAMEAGITLVSQASTETQMPRKTESKHDSGQPSANPAMPFPWPGRRLNVAVIHTPQGIKVYRCQRCKRHFGTKKAVTSHLVRSHNIRGLGVAELPPTTEIAGKINYKLKPNGNKEFTGTVNKDQYQNIEQRNQPSKSAESNDGKNFSCPFCPRLFYTSKGLNTHKDHFHLHEKMSVDQPRMSPSAISPLQQISKFKPSPTSTAHSTNTYISKSQEIYPLPVPKKPDPPLLSRPKCPFPPPNPLAQNRFVNQNNSGRQRGGSQANQAARCPECRVLLPSQQFLDAHRKRFHGITLPQPSESTSPAPSYGSSNSSNTPTSVSKPVSNNGSGSNWTNSQSNIVSASLSNSQINKPKQEELKRKIQTDDDENEDEVSIVKTVKPPPPKRSHLSTVSPPMIAVLDKHKPLNVNLRLPDGQYKCPSCPRVYPTRLSLTGHLKLHYNQKLKPFPCPHCLRRFTTKSNLRYHVLKFCRALQLKEGGPSDEDMAGLYAVSRTKRKISSTEDDLASANAGLECLHCQAVFPNRALLEEHAKIQHCSSQEGMVDCLHCGRSFASYMAFRIHMTRSHGSPPASGLPASGTFDCPRCHMIMPSLNARANHMRICCNSGTVDLVNNGLRRQSPGAFSNSRINVQQRSVPTSSPTNYNTQQGTYSTASAMVFPTPISR